MASVKLIKHFDYYVPGSKMISYPPGDHDMPEAHAKAAIGAGLTDQPVPAPEADAVVKVAGKGK